MALDRKHPDRTIPQLEKRIAEMERIINALIERIERLEGKVT